MHAKLFAESRNAVLVPVKLRHHKQQSITATVDLTHAAAKILSLPNTTERPLHHLEVIDLPTIMKQVAHPWFNQTLCRVHQSVVRLGVVEGQYHWHKHDELDEFFYVVEGCLMIELEGQTVELIPQQAFVVPRGCGSPHSRRRAHDHVDGRR